MKKTPLNLKEAIELGEYDPTFLSNYPEWRTLSRHVQFEYVRKGLDNRNKQLLLQWAEVNNILDFSKKPELKGALKNIEKQMSDLTKERERLYLEYSS